MIPEPAPYSNRGGLLNIQTPEEVTEERAGNPAGDPVITSLAGHVRTAFSAALRSKQAGEESIERRLLKCDRMRAGKYDPEFQRELNNRGTSDIYMMLADVKCRALEAWLKDAMLPAGEKPFHLDPTPIPELPPDITQGITDGVLRFFEEGVATGRIAAQDVEELGPKAMKKMRGEILKELQDQAKKSADELTTEVDDSLKEGGWYAALSDIIEDVATYPTAFMEGPIIRKKRNLQWFQTPDGGFTPTPVDELVREYERFSPYDAFPSPGAKSAQDGSFIRRLHYTRSDLTAMLGVDGYDETAIRTVLVEYPEGLREWHAYEQEQSDLQDRPIERADPEGKIDCLKFWGNVQGRKLIEWGMSAEEITDPDAEYAAIVYLIGRHVISARLNSHPLKKRNIYTASFKNRNDTIWGQSPPELMQDVSSICNACARNMVDNMALAAGPQTWVISDRIPPGENVNDIYPHKLWQFTSDKVEGRTDLPMGFFQPDSLIDPLLKLYDYFFKQASEITGIPAYIYGSDKVGGAGATASGLSMLMNAASKTLRSVALNIDSGIIRPSVKGQWLHIMINEPQKAKGDIKVVARASDYMIQMEVLQMRRNELLNTVNASPIAQEIIGKEGFAEILRENVKGTKMQVDKIVPDREQIVQDTAEAKINEFILLMSQALNMDPQQLVQMLEQQKQMGPQPGKPGAQDASGAPVAGGAARVV